MKKQLLTILALAIYIFVFEWVFHGGLLGGHYQATAELWRPEADMQQKMGWMIGGQLLIAVFLVQIFARLTGGYLQMGALLGALYGSGQLVMYCVAPYPLDLTLIWIVGGVVEYAVAGLVYGIISGLLDRR